MCSHSLMEWLHLALFRPPNHQGECSNGSVISIRSFRPPDLARLYKLDQACFPPGIAYSEFDLRRFIASPRSSCWIAEEDGWLAGFTLIERLLQNRHRTGHVITIDVDAQMRRRGVGRLLLDFAAGELRGEGVSAMVLEVAENNDGARAFYERMEFRQMGKIPRYYPGGVTALVMGKEL